MVGGAFDVLIGHRLPAAADLEFEKVAEQDRGNYLEFAGLLRNKQHGSESPVLFLHPKDWNKEVVVWLDETGKAGLFDGQGKLKPEIQALVDEGCSVAGIDLLYQGEFNADGKPPAKARRVKQDRACAAFTAGYNHPVFAQRVHDVLTLVSFVRNHEQKPSPVSLVALNGAGAWGAAALAQAGGAIDRTAIDTAGFRFAKLTEFDDLNFLHGAAKYGDVPGLLALAAPYALWLSGEGSKPPQIVSAAYAATDRANNVTTYDDGEEGEAAAAVEWLLK